MWAVNKTPNRVTVSVALGKRWFQVRSLLAPRRALELVLVGSTWIAGMRWTNGNLGLSIRWKAGPRNGLGNVIVGVVERAIRIWALRRVHWEDDVWVGDTTWRRILLAGLASDGLYWC